MKIGVCAGIPAYVIEGPGQGAGQAGPGTGKINGAAEIDIISLAAELGYDYVELPLSPTAALDDAAYERVRAYIGASAIKCECMNVFVPAKIRLTGDGYDERAIAGYADLALARAAGLGAGIVVFGSGGARNIPDGYPYDKAFAQLVGAVQIMSDAAEKHGVKIAIESLNRNETNIINNLPEAERLMRKARRNNIKLLWDFYHFSLESDSIEELRRLTDAGDVIHAHFADPDGRVYPSKVKPEFLTVFGALRNAGYAGRCSIEARIENTGSPAGEMAAGLAALRKITG
jgi:sugar phosphate isomerase/epimerase